jgi:hypothetical protein
VSGRYPEAGEESKTDNKDQLREYLKWTDALLRSMETCLRGDDSGNVWKYAGFRQFVRKYNQIIGVVAQSITLPPILDMYDLDQIPGLGNTIAVQQKDLFESVHANASVLKAFLEGKLGVIDDEIGALRDFLQARLRSAVLRPPEKERDIQDAIEQVLIGRGLVKGQDYDRETGRVKVSIKEVIPDFILVKLNLALEVKLISEAGRAKTVVDEINADIMSYSKSYRRLFFVVYDLGFIRVEEEFRRDLEADGRVSVVIVKH